MTINQMIQRAKAAYPRYLASSQTDIRRAYSSPSNAKISAWEFHKNVMKTKYKGFDMRVISHTCHFFTCGFCYRDGEQLHFVYITPNNYTDVEVSE